MMAAEVKYHAKCLVQLYNRGRQAEENEKYECDPVAEMHGLAFARLVLYLEEFRHHQTVQTFKLADLVKLYSAKLQNLGVPE